MLQTVKDIVQQIVLGHQTLQGIRLSHILFDKIPETKNSTRCPSIIQHTQHHEYHQTQSLSITSNPHPY